MTYSDKDHKLKMQVSAILRRMGYNVFSEVELSTYSYQEKYSRKDVTDFDVLGALIEPDLGVWYAVAECKSQTAKAMENLLKLNGVKDFFQAHKAYYVQTKMDPNAREVGHSLGIWCLDAKNVLTLMSSLGISDKIEVENESNIYESYDKLRNELKKDFHPQIRYLRYDFWTLPSNRNIINLMALMSNAAEQISTSNKSHLFLVHELVTAFAFSTICLAGEVMKKNVNDFPGGLLTAILGGARERRDKEALFDMISKTVPDSNFNVVPDFFEKYAELVFRYLSNTSHSHKTVSCLSDMTRQLIYPEAEKVDGKLNDNHSEITIKLARDAIYFVMKLTGLKEKCFSQALEDS
ncbi:hypothetical protein KAR91_41695 [Candidatus Pacearchaeota archaeon]|nr:hypothetical protein [Candidatus Pacearchaeota archaeon]